MTEETHSVYARSYDRDSTRNWSSDPDINALFLRAVQNNLNDRLRARGYLFLNEVHAELGLAWTKAGQLVGWLWSSDNPQQGISIGQSEGIEGALLLDFNVQGEILHKIENLGE